MNVAAPRLAVASLFALALGTFGAPAHAVTDNFCKLDSTSGFSLNGNAYRPIGADYFRLAQNVLTNQRGSAFVSAPFPFPAGTSFHAFFRFRSGPSSGGADGLVFVIQSNNNNALGANGGDLGYGGIGQSVGIEFDTYQNGWDPSANHVALLFDGDTHNHVASAAPPFTIAGNQTTYAWIDYDGVAKQIQVFVAQSATKPAMPVLSAAADIKAHLGTQAWVGFTGSTGGTTNSQDVYELEFSTDGYPCCTSAPSGACGAPQPVCGGGGLCVQCGSNTDCSAPTPKCDTATSTCVACLASTDCSAPTPVCNPATHACVGCLSSTDCGGTTPVCATMGASQGSCVQCESNADCTKAAPVCDPATNQCGCVTDTDCAAGEVCDKIGSPTGQCLTGCHVIGGVDSCSAGSQCSKQDGTVGTCQTVSTSSSSSATGSGGGATGSGGATTGSGGAGGTSPTGTGGATTGSASSGSVASSSGAAGGAGGAGGSAAQGGSGNEDIIAIGGGCWCGVGGSGEIDPKAVAGAALLAAAIAGRRRRRA
ncbi:PE-PGRS family protein [Minicystis rosea]|nr:PE-PGRS family protein [Minicystis rosea]